MLGKGLTQLGAGAARCGYSTTLAIRPTLPQQIATRQLLAPLASAPFRQIRGIETEHQSRKIETERFTPTTSYPILVAQRKLRPVSPHLSIYRLQINYFTSPFHRLTGVLVSGTFYIFGLTYLVAPLLGWSIDSASLAAAFGSLPAAAKVAAKFALAFLFTFHSVNGVGHLIWDTGRRFSTKAIVRQGWTVVGVSLVAAGWLASL